MITRCFIIAFGRCENGGLLEAETGNGIATIAETVAVAVAVAVSVTCGVITRTWPTAGRWWRSGRVQAEGAEHPTEAPAE